MKATFTACILSFAAFTALHAQERLVAYSITVNTNIYLPQKAPTKGVFPMVRVDKESEKTVTFGGIGAGLSAARKINSKILLKGQINYSRHTYNDEPMYLLSDFGYVMGESKSATKDDVLATTLTGHYQVLPRIFIGSGLGAQFLLKSVTSHSNIYDPLANGVFEVNLRNHAYRKIMPTLPVELSYIGNRFMFNLRYEQGLLSHYANELKELRPEKFGLLTFELGMRFSSLMKPDPEEERKKRKTRKVLGPTF